MCVGKDFRRTFFVLEKGFESCNFCIQMYPKVHKSFRKAMGNGGIL